MALIIKAQMPKGCEWTDKTSRTGMGYCPLKDRCMAYREELSKQYTINAHPIDYIPSDCPIIGEIPDKHGRLISESDLASLIVEDIKRLDWTDEYTDEEKNLVREVYQSCLYKLGITPTILEARR